MRHRIPGGGAPWIATLALALVAPASWATPIVWGGAIARPLKWPAGSTINVWIQKIDPDGPDSRQQLFADGVLRWAEELDRGYTVSVNLGDPPPGTQNLVRFTWRNPGTQHGGFTLGFHARAIVLSRPDATNSRLDNASGVIDNTLPSPTAPGLDESQRQQRRFLLRNLGVHEFSHALGLADDPTGLVTRSGQLPADTAMDRGFNLRDRQEITQLYGRRPAQGGGAPRGRATPDPENRPGSHTYYYDFEGLDDEHITLVTLAIDPTLVDAVDVPAGWLLLDPNDPSTLDPEAPFYAGFMDDAATDPPPWSSSEPLGYFAFRATDDTSALTPSNPRIAITLHTSGDRLGLVSTWAGELQTVLGPVPAPEPALPVLVGFGALLLRRRVAAARRAPPACS